MYSEFNENVLLLHGNCVLFPFNIGNLSVMIIVSNSDVSGTSEYTSLNAVFNALAIKLQTKQQINEKKTKKNKMHQNLNLTMFTNTQSHE